MFLLKKLIYKAFFGVEINRGRIVLGHGSPEQIEVNTEYTPFEVTLKFKNQYLPTVCIGERDFFDVKIVPFGFILVNKINSIARDIEWESKSNIE